MQENSVMVADLDTTVASIIQDNNSKSHFLFDRFEASVVGNPYISSIHVIADKIAKYLDQNNLPNSYVNDDMICELIEKELNL